ncbi:class A beta-lactamase-related serine hydrolase [Aurantiacibacter xanthus]|uniref:Class A beta-lactamase-related serine hydrolase n=1 Tax=Aurantiacibacter xanthus TaxID=1784712 RepID=A0A3A1NYX4_9SPHN|nr:serine hydrolase domain-containing protein [Aurantiacibacter xanthus]RIV80105.1 class A beta-lactamase-related serine hydrolase [Aurantiacibacter xanthus]
MMGLVSGKRHMACVLAVLSSGVAGCVNADLPSSAELSVAPAQTAEVLQDELAHLVAAGRIPGAMVRIARADKTLADVTVGYRDLAERVPLGQDSIFRFYSMSKPITSAAIMMLVEEGKLSLDDPAADYLPEWSDMRVYVSGGLEDMVTQPARRSITIADLLTHTSGITYHFTGDTPVHQYYRRYGVMRDTPVGRRPEDGPPARDLDELVERLGHAPMLHQPGEEFAYSYSTTVLGAIIERASGMRLDRFLQERLFVPLGMTDTGFFVSDADLPRFITLYSANEDGLSVVELPASSDYRDTARLLDGGGAIAGTMDDYVRFAQMLANGGMLDGRRILSEQSVAAMLVPRVKIGGMGAETTWIGYGLALGTPESEAGFGLPAGGGSWSGSGNTYFFIDPKRKGVAVLMTHFLDGAQVQGELRDLVNRSYYSLVAGD